MKYTLRIEDRNGTVVDRRDLGEVTPQEASRAARELQETMRSDSRDGVVVPYRSD